MRPGARQDGRGGGRKDDQRDVTASQNRDRGGARRQGSGTAVFSGPAGTGSPRNVSRSRLIRKAGPGEPACVDGWRCRSKWPVGPRSCVCRRLYSLASAGRASSGRRAVQGCSIRSCRHEQSFRGGSRSQFLLTARSICCSIPADMFEPPLRCPGRARYAGSARRADDGCVTRSAEMASTAENPPDPHGSFRPRFYRGGARSRVQCSVPSALLQRPQALER